MKLPAIIAPVIKKRSACLFISLSALLFVLLNISGIFVWKCPFHAYTGLDCAGCGMTRGITALFHGHFTESFKLHPFSLPAALLWLFCSITAVIPGRHRETLLLHLEKFEEKTGLAFILIILYLLFGTARLMLEILA